jgi:pyruvate/2-oxoglutarate dehydrogenase complex dihydrolipoamide dehydrogenase (E3) component
MAATSYDAIVIGTGQAGGPLATALGSAGMRTAIIERALVGGTCINYGCTPTKTMVASARVAYLARRGADYGVETGAVRVDMVRVRQRKRDVVASFREGSERRLIRSERVELIRGEARFTGPHEVEVKLSVGGSLQLSAPRIFINTGARATSPPIPGLDAVPALDNASVMELDTVPEHLLVLGGGYIGLEFGQMFRRFGSEVTVIHHGDKLLAREDADVADEVARIMTEDGVRLVMRARTTGASAAGARVRLDLETPDGETQMEGSHLLVATGRVPDTRSLSLEAADIKADQRGYIQVNDRLETSAEGVWALGDVKPGPAFTHISYDDFRIVKTNVLEKGNASIKDRMVPYTVFIDPQLGRIGLSEAEARDRGLEVRVAKMPMKYVARAIELSEDRGFMKALVDKDDQIVGAAVLGLEGGELMAMFEIAMMGKLPYQKLRDATFAHPTLAESLNNLFGSL